MRLHSGSAVVANFEPHHSNGSDTKRAVGTLDDGKRSACYVTEQSLADGDTEGEFQAQHSDTQPSRYRLFQTDFLNL